MMGLMSAPRIVKKNVFADPMVRYGCKSHGDDEISPKSVHHQPPSSHPNTVRAARIGAVRAQRGGKFLTWKRHPWRHAGSQITCFVRFVYLTRSP